MSSERGRRASAPAAARARARAREFSAGGVVVRGDEVVVIVPTRRAADGSRVLALPKGHVDPGETPCRPPSARSARRPASWPSRCTSWARRATGIAAAGGRSASRCRFFLFDYVDGDIADHDDEVEEVRWIGARGGPAGAQPRGRARDGRAADRRTWRPRVKTGSLPLRAGPELLLHDLRRRAQARPQDGHDPARRQVRQVPQEPGSCWSRSATSTRRASGSSRR